MHIGIFAKVFARQDLDEALRLIGEFGMHHTQFNMSCVGLPSMPEQIPPGLANRIKAGFDQHDMNMVALSGTFNMIHPNPDVVADGLRRLGILAASSHQMGTHLITLCTGTRDPDDMWRRHPDNDGQEAWVALLRAVERALMIAETDDIYLGIEPEQANVVNSARKAKKLLDHFRSRRLGIVIDPANLFERAEKSHTERVVEEAFDLLGETIVMAHAKDRDEHGRFVAAGRGVLNYDHYVAQLRRINYEGTLILHGLSEDEVKPCVDFLHEKCGVC
jgi:sugar phosphate isomerase/epimerase